MRDCRRFSMVVVGRAAVARCGLRVRRPVQGGRSGRYIRLIASGHAVGLRSDLFWVDVPAGVRLVDLSGAPHREIFAAMRVASSARLGPGVVCDTLRDASPTRPRSRRLRDPLSAALER